jgi:hypothetical protein
MAVAVDALGPHLRPVLPYLHMVVQTHGQMVGYKIFCGHSQVERVPVLEFLQEGTREESVCVFMHLYVSVWMCTLHAKLIETAGNNKT